MAREYVRRGLPLSVIVMDYLHWKHLGDWDPAAWPASTAWSPSCANTASSRQ